MDKSKFLGKLIGLYLIIVSVAMYIHMHQIASLMSGFVTFPALMMTAGLMTLIIGLLLVLYHNIWQWSWKVVITIVGWILLLKSISILMFPHYISVLTLFFIMHHSFQYGGYGVDFLLGAFLAYMGFKKG